MKHSKNDRTDKTGEAPQQPAETLTDDWQHAEDQHEETEREVEEELSRLPHKPS